MLSLQTRSMRNTPGNLCTLLLLAVFPHPAAGALCEQKPHTLLSPSHAHPSSSAFAGERPFHPSLFYSLWGLWWLYDAESIKVALLGCFFSLALHWRNKHSNSRRACAERALPHLQWLTKQACKRKACQVLSPQQLCIISSAKAPVK